MDAVRAYLLRVTVAALVCGIVNGFATKRTSLGPMVKFLCSMLMAVVLLTPTVSIRADILDAFWDEIFIQGDNASYAGQIAAQDVCGDIIKEKVAAYILDKAETYGADLTVEVVLGDSIPPVPQSLRISGRISPYGKKIMTGEIEKELGIKAEAQQWIG